MLGGGRYSQIDGRSHSNRRLTSTITWMEQLRLKVGYLPPRPPSGATVMIMRVR